MLLTLLTAPLGLIGVAWGMLLFGKAMGFVAILGVLAPTAPTPIDPRVPMPIPALAPAARNGIAA